LIHFYKRSSHLGPTSFGSGERQADKQGGDKQAARDAALPDGGVGAVGGT